MKIPPYYTLFCVLVLGVFAYAKYHGLAFGSTGSTNSNGGGGHTSGVFIGSHK